jgi:hypothetical protein
VEGSQLMSPERKAIKLSGDRPGWRWLIFPSQNLLRLFLRRTGPYDYIQVWNDAQGFGLEAIRRSQLPPDEAARIVPNQIVFK